MNFVRMSAGILIISLVTLMVELFLMRVFDVILWSNISYMVISCAMFSFGLAGIYRVVRPLPAGEDVLEYLSRLAVWFSLSTLAILPMLNFLPFSFDSIVQKPLLAVFPFLGMYLVLMIPFFFSGLIFTTLFSAYPGNIQSLYLWDLCGGAFGCILLLPFLPKIGPGGLVFLSSGLILVASALFSSRHKWILVTLFGAVLIIAVPFSVDHSSIDFRFHDDKRGVKSDVAKGLREFSRWDPISKIDVIDKQEGNKHIAYDGGSQSSNIYPFDGDFDCLRSNLFDLLHKHFWFRGVLASHYLKRDTGHKALVIGSAGGQEIKAALVFGANRVDAIEMVGTVVEIGKNQYSAYNGGIFSHPAVHASVGEGRSFLRESKENYDVIQIFSTHTTSSIAAGTGAMQTVYLQTVEAYKEYFTHLTKDGILHVNHFIYPRMITTASAAWKELGRSDFRKHVVVFERHNRRQDNLPTMLVKMSGWKPEEIADLVSFFSAPAKDNGISGIVENPVDPGGSFLPQEFFYGILPNSLTEKLDYIVRPPTDNQPFFLFLRKKIGRLMPSPDRFLNSSTAEFLNSSLKRGVIPLDIIHLPVTAAVSMFYALIFIVIPLRFSEAGRSRWEGKFPILVYFSCLGAGFIIFELIFVHLFMKLVGYPLYTYSAVIFTMLVSAGTGSLASKYIVSKRNNAWYVPFVGIILTSLLIIFGNKYIFDLFLSASTPIRVLVCFLMIFPLGFFLGMPFPLGILGLENKPRGAIAWAWGINGLFTVIGGFTSVIISLIFGFQASLTFALLLYLVAFALFPVFNSNAKTGLAAPIR